MSYVDAIDKVAVPKPARFYTPPQFAHVFGVPVAYRRQGNGEAVVLFHGAGFTRMWLPLYEMLASRVDFIAPEAPGFGETPLLKWFKNFDDLTILYDQFFETLGVDKIHLIGFSFRNFIGALKKGRVKVQAQLTYDEMLQDRYIMVGSPETVKNQLGEYCENVGAGGILAAGASYGPMPNWMVTKNMQIFSEEIMPAFRDADGKPDRLRHEPLAPRTRAEFAAQNGRPPEPARSLVTGSTQLIDHRVAPVPAIIDVSLREHPGSKQA